MPTWNKESLRRLVQREMGEYRLVVVSNRQPYIHEFVEGELRYVVPSGGVTTALDPIMQECGGTWVAYGGGKGDWYAVDDKNKIMVPPDDPAYTLRLVWLTEAEEQGYYDGFSNTALWPLCHNAYTEPVFNLDDWETYKSVNQEFARHVLDEIGGQPAAVFTQDYHLAMLPRLIREADPDIITGQFWHIPWPNPEIFRICPWQDELLDGLLGNDMLGFHIGDHCNNFLDTVSRTLTSRVDHEYSRISYKDELTVVRPFPISVDFEQINQDAEGQYVDEEMDRLTASRERIGPVNLVAADELERIESEHGSNAAEQEELREAVSRLRGSIGNLNREGRERLRAAFEQVDQHFQKLFARLFEGGVAHLALIDSDDPLEAGLEIYAQPPGKRLQSLTLLSGGEQALTAIALTFALFLTNPAPICVLDEVDAPLDDANIDRFCDLLEAMTQETSTRYLIVTHNAVTMSRMHRLFGVTMIEKGVSRLVSVDLQAAELLAAE